MKKQVLRLICAGFAAVVLTFSAKAAPQMLVPGGSTVGIKLHTKGLMITAVEEGSAAKKAGLKKGDIIVQADGEAIHTIESLKDTLKEEDVILTVLRNGKEAEFCVSPIKEQLGAYVRDTIAGIGTITYYDPISGAFGALGHGVNDTGSSELIPVEDGVLVESSVSEVKKGKTGTPGELKGVFDLQQILGSVERNCAYGIFGELSEPLSQKPLYVAQHDEVEVGKATILSNVSGDTVKEYSVQILKVFSHEKQSGRNLLLKITDRELLGATGGIVQGMSGSPIIQNGKLVGAVTHVLVNDPTKGYGIFIENMLDAAG